MKLLKNKLFVAVALMVSATSAMAEVDPGLKAEGDAAKAWMIENIGYLGALGVGVALIIASWMHVRRGARGV